MNGKLFLAILLSLALVAAVLVLGTAVLAKPSAGSGAPTLISYQGYLTDDSDQPVSGNVTFTFGLYADSSGGSPIWEETQNDVPVDNGYFSVLLGSVTPLSASDFDGTTRYLEVSVDTGGGFVDLPRQQLATVPYALQAEEAQSASTAMTATFALSAAEAPWSGLTDVPAGFADGVDNTGGGYEHVIVVAKSGGDYTSVAEALNSISSPSSSNRYLVWVAPGVYTETLLVQVQEYVHLQGVGSNAIMIKSSRTHTSQGPDAATVQLDDNGRISDVSIINEGTGTYGIAIYSALATRDTVIDNAVVEANGSGGTGHYGVYLNDAEPTIRNSVLKASGATGFGTAVNAALGSVNISGGFPQALIIDSILIGGGNNDKENCTDNTGTGFGLQLSSSSPNVRDSYICGGHRGIAVYTNGHVIVQNSNLEVSSNNSAYLFEISSSGSVSLASSGVTYFSPRKITGAGTGLRCVHAYDNGTFEPKSDGTSAATACD